MGRLLWFGRGPANVGYWTDPAAATDSPSIGISQADPFPTYGALEPFGAEADYLPLFVKNPLARRPNSAKATPSKASGERKPPEATNER